MPSSPGQNCPECSGQEGGISAHFRFCVYASQMFLVLIKLRNWKRPSWDQYGTTLTQSLPKATRTCPVPCLRSEGQIDLLQVPCTTQLISLGNLGGGGGTWDLPLRFIYSHIHTHGEVVVAESQWC